MKRVIVLLIGPTASGKSTIRKYLFPEPHDYHSAFQFSVLYSDKKRGMLGGGKTGSEIVRSMYMFGNSLEHGLYECRCSVILVDTVRISESWSKLLNSFEDIHFRVLAVHLDYDLKVLRARLRKRRKRLNLHPLLNASCVRTQNHYIKTTNKAVEGLKKDCKKKVTFLRFSDPSVKPKEIAKRIEKEITKLRRNQ